MEMYKGYIIPDSVVPCLDMITVRELLSTKNCILCSFRGLIDTRVCHESGDTCPKCLLVNPNWRSTVDNNIREVFVDYLLENNYITKADVFHYTLENK